MRALLPATLSLGFAAALTAQTPTSIDGRVDALLRQMTVEEKVGQMTQLTIMAVSRTQGSATVAHELDSLKLDSAIVHYHVGSILNVWDAAFTPAHWRDVTATIQRFAGRTRLKIPVIYGIDAVHGHHYMVGSTLFPQNIALAATWNPDLARRAAEITAYETRASGIPWNFAPVLDLGRQPLWSRFFETFGEDPYLISVLGVATVEAQQRDPRSALAAVLGTGPAGVVARRPNVPGAPRVGGDIFVAATGKHYLGYSLPLSGHDRTTAWIPERQLREYVLPQFRAAIRAGLRTVMVNSGDINGVPVHASKEILTDLLRKELGFTGIAVSDWEDINKLVYMHRVAATPKDAVRMAVMAGIDMSMVPYNVDFARFLVELVREGAVPESRIDEAVRRILRLKLELGLFENALADEGMLANVGAQGFKAVSKAAAEEAVTLLRNERGLLPLAKTSRVLVTGPGAMSLPAMYGSWSYTWQGTDTLMYPKDAKTFLDAIRGQVGAARVTYVPGATFDREVDIAAAATAARSADVAVVALAEFPSTETPGNIDDLVMPAAQLKLARAIESTGTPVVITLFENRPRIIREVVDSARAVVTAYETGPFGGEAMAGVLFGAVNPSGKLPFSYPRFTGAIVPYDRTASGNMTASGPTGGYNPEWPFGHGLSYTTFTYGDLRVASQTLGTNDTLVVTVRLANSGSRAGKEVVQLYVRDMVASIAPPMQRLRAFQKVSLGPGESRSLTLRVPVQELAFIGLDNRPVVEPGEFEVMVGGQAAKFTVR